jgi:hypothetical protein
MASILLLQLMLTILYLNLSLLGLAIPVVRRDLVATLILDANEGLLELLGRLWLVIALIGPEHCPFTLIIFYNLIAIS